MEQPVVRYLDSDGKVHEVEQVSQYKYLGITIDDKLEFTEWTNVLCTEIKRRTQLIQRIAATVKLSRRAMETFYGGYVRGYIQYGASIIQATVPDTMKN